MLGEEVPHVSMLGEEVPHVTMLGEEVSRVTMLGEEVPRVSMLGEEVSHVTMLALAAGITITLGASLVWQTSAKVPAISLATFAALSAFSICSCVEHSTTSAFHAGRGYFGFTAVAMALLQMVWGGLTDPLDCGGQAGWMTPPV
jgi:hypothetical protein